MKSVCFSQEGKKDFKGEKIVYQDDFILIAFFHYILVEF